MRASLRLVALPVLLSQAALAQAPIPPSEDPTLSALIRDALDTSPQLAGAQERLGAEEERVPQARALPDPTLALSYQNDGFDRFAYGRAETTWGAITATQAFPYPGKRQLRAEVAKQGLNAAKAGLERIRMTLEAEVRRAFTALLWTRGRGALLTEQELLWSRAEAAARIRYEAGQGSQVDLLRAQLERTRLRQARAGLDAEERSANAALNRLASRPLDSPVPTSSQLEDLPAPEPPADPQADAEARSPELAEARHHLKHAQSQVDLSRLERRPDFAISAGVMPRGSLPAMWQVGISLSLPIYARQKQQRAQAESEALARSSQEDVKLLRQILAQRTRDRVDRLSAARETLRIYREGLLTQSEATVQSALAQFEVGRTGFATVLESMGGYLADRDRCLGTLAEIQALGIALREVSLAADPGPGGGGAMPAVPSGFPGGSAGMTGAPNRAAAPQPGSTPAPSGM